MKSPSQYHIQKRNDGSNVVDFSAVAEKANIVSFSYLFFYVGIFHFKIGKSITKAIDRIFIRDSVDNLYIGVIALILWLSVYSRISRRNVDGLYVVNCQYPFLIDHEDLMSKLRFLV